MRLYKHRIIKRYALLTYEEGDIEKLFSQSALPEREESPLCKGGQAVQLPFEENPLEEVSWSEIGIILTLLLILIHKEREMT
jgi:hypothetical protein